MRAIIIFLLALCASSKLAAAWGHSGVAEKGTGVAIGTGRRMLDRSESHGGGRGEDDDDDDDDDNGAPSSPSPASSPAGKASPSLSTQASCSLTLGGKTSTYTACFSMEGGSKVYYKMSGGKLSVALTSTSKGYASWAYVPRGGMIGGHAVFAQSCGGTCAKPYTATMQGFNQGQFKSPASIGFGSTAAFSTSQGLATTFTMPWPSSKASIPIMIATGAIRGSSMKEHRGTPRLHTLTSALKQS